MAQILFIGGILGVIATITIALIAQRNLQEKLSRLQVEQKAWERAQEVHQQTWQAQQEKFIGEIEKKLTAQLAQQDIRATEFENKLSTQVEQLHLAWQNKRQEHTEELSRQAKTLTHQYETAAKQSRIEYELARLPRVEDTPLTIIEKGHHTPGSHWQPASLQGADLRSHDLSHRYLGHADLRQAQLQEAKLFMADLSGASLVAADLSSADLTTANLTGADLHGASLVGANFLLTDLNNANLIGANLLKARNLSAEQLATAIYDSTTQLVIDTDTTWLNTSGLPVLLPGSPSPATSTIDNPSLTNSESHIFQQAAKIAEDKEVPHTASTQQEHTQLDSPAISLPTPQNTASTTPDPQTTQTSGENTELTAEIDDMYPDLSMLFAEQEPDQESPASPSLSPDNNPNSSQ